MVLTPSLAAYLGGAALASVVFPFPLSPYAFVERKLEVMKNPPLLRDLAFIVSIGLSDVRVNPH